MGAMFPALDIKSPNVGEQIAQAMDIKARQQQIQGAQQQQQLGAVQLEEAQRNAASRAALMRIWADNDGDMNATIEDAKASGQVTPEHLQAFQLGQQQIQTQAALLQKDQLENKKTLYGMAANKLDAVKQLPLMQRPQALMNAYGELLKAGADPNDIGPHVEALTHNPTDDAITNYETSIMGGTWAADQQLKALEVASKPTAAQAQAKTAAELDSAQTAALIAHQQLLNLPTPEEAKTKRMADLRETVAKTLQANADTAEKTAQTALIGAQPVFAYDPQTLQRVLTTMPQVGAKGLTNPVKASEGDINKETEVTRQFNDVQMNVSRYRNAVNAIAHNLSSDSASNIAGILSNEKVGGLLDKLPGGAITADQLKQTVTARAWNALTSDEQDAVTGYLRAKGSIIAFQKALTQTGRTSKEALEIEMQNLPSPLVGSTVANKQLDAFQENIDTASKGIVRVPWLPTTQDVRQSIEGVNVSTGKTTGQFERPRSPISTGGTGGVQVGQIINRGGAAMRVTKVYPNGSYDAEPR